MKPRRPKYSVIMTCLLNRGDHKSVVEDTIASVKEHSEDYELIIVDDGSTLPTGFLKEEADLYIRHNPRNWGLAPGWNDGLKVARGEFIVIINDDIRVKDGWLDGMAKAFDYEKTGVAGPAVEHIKHRTEGVEESYKWFPGYCYMLSRKTVNEFMVKEMEANKKLEPEKQEKYPGHFDEQFLPFNCEDVDYWQRLRNQGYRLMRVWDVEIWHKEGDTVHHMNYDEQSKIANAKFTKKHGIDPVLEYFS